MILATAKVLAVMAGKEILEFLIIDGSLKLIGRSAKGSKNTMTTNNISFQSILSRVNLAEQLAQTVTNVTASTTQKIVDVSKSAVSAVGGVMPVTNNKLDVRTERLLALIEEQGIQIDALYAMLGLTKPVPSTADVSSLVAARMHTIKFLDKKEEEPVVAPAPQPVIPVISAEQEQIAKALGIALNQLVVQPQPEATTQPVVAPIPTQVSMPTANTSVVEKASQMASGASDQPVVGGQIQFKMGTPTNWHQQ